MERKLTIDDIARELNISKTTVSRAISGKGRIGKETRTKVIEYIKENNYKPSALARGLAQSKSFNIGFVMADSPEKMDLSFGHEFLWRISRVASKAEYDVLVSVVSKEDMTQLARVIENNKVDGIVLGQTINTEGLERYLKEKDVPYIVLENLMDDFRKNNIAEMAELCFDKLLSYIE